MIGESTAPSTPLGGRSSSSGGVRPSGEEEPPDDGQDDDDAGDTPGPTAWLSASAGPTRMLRIYRPTTSRAGV